MTNKRPTQRKLNTENLVENSIKKPTPRHNYLLEREKIKTEIGDLENIRLSLGLSQRRICMLLLVDPSAWTRWIKTEAPPHIYQALRWLLELRKVNPEITMPSNIESRVELLQSTTHSKIRDLENSVEALERSLALVSTVQPATPPDFSKLIEVLAKSTTSKNAVRAKRKVKKKKMKKIKRKDKPQPKSKSKIKVKKVAKKVRARTKKKRRSRS